ncbi:SIMPL domain-containing protein [Bartonella ancashensis]|uniref:Outer membrane protein n=1 Tax=Bartonella ancashensis TaxID=1318743 RepID=A0A0M4LGM0_9HYPH|nr:SIMPL domain-containing protein [Bartonella ancashensis]ALE03607.1 Protein of unknown function DUF541 [Bartonella ancashensis]
MITFHTVHTYWLKTILLITLALPITSLVAQAQNSSMNNSIIVVTATGESKATPDMAIINLAVVTYDKTAQKALATNNTSMNNVIGTLKESGIPENDLQTSNLSIYQINPEKYREQKDSENLYQVSNSLTVRIRDLSKAGKIFDQTMALGVNSVDGITFTNSDSKPFYKEARKKAVTEAIEKAKILAQEANVKLGKIIEIYENDNGQNPMPRLISRAQTTSYDADTNFSGGELNYYVSVTMTFSID